MVSIIIPYRETNEDRKKAYDYVVAYYNKLFPESEIITADSPYEYFNRGPAINKAVKEAKHDIIVLSDADSLMTPEMLQFAIDNLDKYSYIVPFLGIDYLSKESSQLIYENAEDPYSSHLELERTWNNRSLGGINIMKKENFYKVGGFDPNFQGWGFEDTAFSNMMEASVGPIGFGSSKLRHLYHADEGGQTSSPIYKNNELNFQRYKNADIESLRNIANELQNKNGLHT